MANVNGHPEEYYSLLNKITNIFTRRWNEGFKKIRGSKSKALLKRFMPAVYRRWYFSALTEDSPLTPANLVLALNKEFGVSDLATPRLSSRLDTRANSKGGEVPVFELTDFCIEGNAKRHPLVRDLRVFLDGLSPAYESDWHKNGLPEALDGLTLNDIPYLDFLDDICASLKLVKRIPSVNNQVGTVNASYPSFFDNSDDVILKKIVNGVVSMTLDSLCEILPLKRTYKAKLQSYIKRPQPIDKIFDDMFYDSGIDIIKLLENFDNNIDILGGLEGFIDGIGSDFQPELITGAFFLGVELDRHFLTPLGYYLRIIQPMYIIPYDIAGEMDGLGELMEGMDDLGPLIYAPCASYASTSLSERLYGASDDSDAGLSGLIEGTDIRKFILSLDDILDKKRNPQTKASKHNESNNSIMLLSLKLTLSSNSRIWVNVTVHNNMTLAALHSFICYAFDFEPYENYSFFMGDQENPFAEYKNGVAKARTPENTSLEVLKLEPDSSLLYRLYVIDGRKIKRQCLSVNIKVMNAPEMKPGVYPRISRRSKAFIEQYGGDEW